MRQTHDVEVRLWTLTVGRQARDITLKPYSYILARRFLAMVLALIRSLRPWRASEHG
jgi:hypothetical protein